MSRPALAWLQGIFGEDRVGVTFGDSAVTLPSVLASVEERGLLCCDVVVVDGAHTYSGAMLDIINAVRCPSPAAILPHHFFALPLFRPTTSSPHHFFATAPAQG